MNTEATTELIIQKKSQLTEEYYEIGFLCMMALLAGFMKWMKPDSFDFPFLQPVHMTNVQRFAPLFLIGILLASYYAQMRTTAVITTKDEYILFLNSLIASIVGCREEIGFRYIFVCIAVIALTSLNWILGTPLAIGIGGLMMLTGYRGVENGETAYIRTIKTIQTIVGAMIIWAYFSVENPVYWINTQMIVPIADTITFGLMHKAFYDEGYSKIIIFSFIIANIAYALSFGKGIFNFMHAWYFGAVMIYATLYYGLWTAVCIHIAYNLEVTCIHYVMHKAQKGVELQ